MSSICGWLIDWGVCRNKGWSYSYYIVAKDLLIDVELLRRFWLVDCPTLPSEATRISHNSNYILFYMRNTRPHSFLPNIKTKPPTFGKQPSRVSLKNAFTALNSNISFSPSNPQDDWKRKRISQFFADEEKSRSLEQSRTFHHKSLDTNYTKS